MKSWKNRRNTYWILIATIFGLVFPSNQTNNYKNIIGLLLCWTLYWFCFFHNNQEVEEQERKEKEEHQKRIKLELAKREREYIEKEKKKQEFYKLVECPKIINYIMVKYNRDWEKDLYPIDARYHINDIKRRIKSDIEFKNKEICNCNNAIKRIEDLKRKTRFHYKCEELDRRIKAYQSVIDNCQEHIKNISEKQKQQIVFYQNQIERYKEQCRKLERKANNLLQNSPEDLIKAIDYYLKEIEETHKEEKIPYLLQAKSDAINRIKEIEAYNEN